MPESATRDVDVSGDVPVARGMPPLELDGRATSYFEFWPTWLMYSPVVLLWLGLALRYRSLSLPLIANPALPLAGMVGVPKSSIFEMAGEEARRWILPWWVYRVASADSVQELEQVQNGLQSAGLEFPLVGKPEIGCRGAGVKLLQDSGDLAIYLQRFPAGAAIQFQRLSRWQAEAGIFYVRDPYTGKGSVPSLTLKYTPYVLGDGVRTLRDLVRADPRAGALLHLYEERHQDQWHRVIPEGQAYRLVFSASHCRGAVFRDAQHLITTDLAEALDRIFADIPEFYYGRLDVKFRDIDSLRRGEDFEIIEINGASSESINIWDREATLGSAMATLLKQYRTLFKLGASNRARGHRPPGLLSLLGAWQKEKRLVASYPAND